MIYLSGGITVELLETNRPDLGIMFQPGIGNDINSLSRIVWAADNGCFSQGEKFDSIAWLYWLEKLIKYQHTNLFAVAPDVLGSAKLTIERSLPFLPLIRNLGYKAAFVAQDGLTPTIIEPLFGLFDWLFLGGTGIWKLSEDSSVITKLCLQRNIPVHMGRVNSKLRFLLAKEMGCTSVDGTYLKFGPRVNFPKLISWLDHPKKMTYKGKEIKVVEIQGLSAMIVLENRTIIVPKSKLVLI